jgi:hypothetical protein
MDRNLKVLDTGATWRQMRNSLIPYWANTDWTAVDKDEATARLAAATTALEARGAALSSELKQTKLALEESLAQSQAAQQKYRAALREGADDLKAVKAERDMFGDLLKLHLEQSQGRKRPRRSSSRSRSPSPGSLRLSKQAPGRVSPTSPGVRTTTVVSTPSRL